MQGYFLSRMGGMDHFDIYFPLISLSKIFSTRLEIIFLLAPVNFGGQT